jgi:hypothetical protein
MIILTSSKILKLTEEKMAERVHSRVKPGCLFYSIITAVIIACLITPLSTIKSYALDIPIPTYPQNYAHTTPDSDPPLGVPSFSWSTVLGANVYRLQVDSENGFNQPIYLDISTRNSSFTPQFDGHLFSDGEWFWRVRVEDPSPVSDWSPIFRFTKTWATPNHKPGLHYLLLTNRTDV